MLPPAIFRFCSRAFVAVYGRVPIFGELRSSIGVLRRGDEYLLQQRNDGLGWAFPGGVAWIWESDEQALRREIMEETGVTVGSARKLFVYRDTHYIPSLITVFALDASDADGEARGSWEGDVQWRKLDDVRLHFFISQQPILEYLASI